jgi:hypothetical protein
MARVPPGQAKEAIMSVGLVATGIFDFLERLEKGQHPVMAAKDAVQGVQRRGAVIQKAAKEMNAKPKSFSCQSCSGDDARAAEFANGRPAWQCENCGHLNPRAK